MRRFIIAMVALLLVGCGAADRTTSLEDVDTDASGAGIASTTTAAPTTTTTEATTTTAAPTTTTTEPRPATPKLGDKVTNESGATLQFFGYQQPVPPDDESSTPGPGMEFALVDVEVCAGTEEVGYNVMAVSAQTADNRRYEYPGTSVREPFLSAGDLQPGACRRGWVTQELPTGQHPKSLLWDYPGWETATFAVP